MLSILPKVLKKSGKESNGTEIFRKFGSTLWTGAEVPEQPENPTPFNLGRYHCFFKTHRCDWFERLEDAVPFAT